MRAAVLAAAVLTLALATPAGSQLPQEGPDPSITDGTALKQLKAAEARWKAEGLRDYRFTVSGTRWTGSRSATARPACRA
jgi:hypothetical protein